MGWKESKQAFQYALPYEQVFQAAMAAVPLVPEGSPDERGRERPLHHFRHPHQLHLLR